MKQTIRTLAVLWFANFLRLFGIAALFFAASWLQVGELKVVTPERDTPSVLEMMIADGTCWVGGNGHPYPNKVLVSTPDGQTMFGQKKVDWLLSDFSRIDQTVIAFCKIQRG